MHEDAFINQIVEKVKEDNPERIILFGSFAYGTPNEESDVDLLIVKDLEVHEIRDFRVQLKLKLWDLIKKWNRSIDIIVDNQDRINQRIADGDRFYQEIMSKGNTIYA